VRQTDAVSDDLVAGLYETVLTEALETQLAAIDAALVRRVGLRDAEAPDRIAQLLARQVVRALEAVPRSDRVAVGIEVAQLLTDALAARLPKADVGDNRPTTPGEVLDAIGEWQSDNSVRFPGRPLIPLLDTTLLTNAPGEPRVGSQVLQEIESADAIDIVMAFVRRSGLRPLRDALRRHLEKGKPLRMLTTTYTGSTEAAALDELADMGAQVRVSYDVSTTRLHAKAWLFHRHSAFSTAYVGSSNLTHSAQNAGMEWNVRVSAARNLDVIDKIEAVFNTYWESVDFVEYVKGEFEESLDRVRRSDQRDVAVLSPVEIRPEPFQERLLELIEVSQSKGYHRNLLVSATGTGKTVMAAVFYARLRAKLPRARLLFVAHRREILEKSRATFRQALRDHAFGEMWVDGSRPQDFDHVFASVQSLKHANLERLAPGHFDVVIIDEFHHAAAPSYETLLTRLEPRELLGLTATPERADGLPILHWFGDRIAAELRLWDAIEQHRLSPFLYYGIHDGTDLSDIPWRRGQGYDANALTDKYTENDRWARFVFAQLADHVDNVATIRCLGFCVSVAHANYMADRFQELGVEAVAVSAKSSDQERDKALADLAAGRIQLIFSVDLLNEGVDIPTVDTLLMLRPTESATLFLQQLGRGLRQARDKSACTVLDFVGLHRREFRFDRRYRALLGGSRRELERAIENGFPFLPAGCHMELDRVAQEIVLRSIREAVPSTWRVKVEELRTLHRDRGAVSLAEYLHETGLELSDVYINNRTWSEMLEAAGVPMAPAGPYEQALRRAVGRLQHIDDRQRLDGYRALLAEGRPDTGKMSRTERRLLRMLVANLGDQVLSDKNGLRDASLQRGADMVWAHPQVVSELRELVNTLDDAPNHLQHAVLDEIPLQVHSRYTRLEMLAAVGEETRAKTPEWREGVYDASAVGADLLAFTLDKTSGDFSPTTRYRDYAISPQLIHWESQSTTSANSPTGRRYREHVQMGRSILLFARASTVDRAFWFLGPATYVSHEGERPMAVTWRLQTPLSGDLFAAFAAAVA
jgi:superfamily II DNA or RNA helicase/HKD family nuclease